MKRATRDASVAARGPLSSVALPESPNDLLVSEFVARLKALNYSPNTIRGYDSAARAFLRTYPNVPFSAISVEHVERFLLAMPVSARTKSLRLEELRAFFKWLVNIKLLLKDNPCDRAQRPRWQYRHRAAPSWADFERIRAACETFEETLLVEFVYFTGLRLEEFRTLRWDMVDLAQRRGRVIGKGGRERWFVFPPRVAVLLEQATQIKQNPGGWVFPAPAVGVGLGWPWGHVRIAKMLRTVGKRAGLPYALTAHVLRHGWFRLMKTREVPVEVAAKLGGNSIEVAATIYGRLDETDLQAIYDRRIGEVGQ